MHKSGHYGVSMLVFAPVGFLLMLFKMYIPLLLGFGVMMFLSPLPDIDIKIGIIPHRGPTHTVWFALAIGLVCGLLGGVLSVGSAEFIAFENPLLSHLFATGYGFFIGTLGILAHILGDVLTPMGIRPFKPVKDTKYTLDVTKAANKTANFLLWLAGVLVCFVALYAGGYLAQFL